MRIEQPGDRRRIGRQADDRALALQRFDIARGSGAALLPVHSCSGHLCKFCGVWADNPVIEQFRAPEADKKQQKNRLARRFRQRFCSVSRIAQRDDFGLLPAAPRR